MAPHQTAAKELDYMEGVKKLLVPDDIEKSICTSGH